LHPLADLDGGVGGGQISGAFAERDRALETHAKSRNKNIFSLRRFLNFLTWVEPQSPQK
jgi:hypothetical protein